MKAYIKSKYGVPEVLKLEDADRPPIANTFPIHWFFMFPLELPSISHQSSDEYLLNVW